jgi:putative transposase
VHHHLANEAGGDQMHKPNRPELKLTDHDVRNRAVARLREHLPLSVSGYDCTTDMVLDVLIKAAVTRKTVEAVCNDLQNVSDSNTIRAYLNEQIKADDLADLERRVNIALVEGIPARVWSRAREVAFDLHDEPFYGHSPELLAYACRGEARDGTTRFYRVATAYVIVKHLRVILAVLFVRPEDELPEILASLIRRVRILGIPITRLMLDKGFCSIPVFWHIEASGWPAILACPIRGKAGGTKALCQGRASYRTQHTFRSARYGEFTAEVVVVRTLTTHQRSKRGQRHLQWLIYVVFRCDDLSPRQVRRLYRRRFGIETSYRCMGQVRAWTTSRNPALRFLLIALGFILVNLWLELRWYFAQIPRRGGRTIDEGRFELQRMANFLSRAIEALYGVISFIQADVKPLGV